MMTIKQLIALLIIALVPFAIIADDEIFIETLSTISSRDAVDVGPNGNVFSSNYNTGVVYRTSPTGESTEIVAASTDGPAGIEFDANGNMYVAMYNLGSILRYLPDGTSEVFAANVREPIGLDWDSNGNLYVSNFAGPTTVTRIDSDGNVENWAAISSLAAVSSLTVDNADNVYVTGYQDGDVYQVSQSGNVTVFSETGLPGLNFIRYDDVNDKFYATVSQLNQLIEIDNQGNHTVIVDSPTAGAQDGPLDIATIQSSIGLAITDDSRTIYFAAAASIRKYIIADPLVDQLAPYFTGTPLTTATEGTSYTYTFVFSDPNPDALSLELSTIPSWLQFDGTDTISGTPGSSEGGNSYPVTAEVTDGTSTKSQSYSIAVTAVAPPAPPPTPAPAPTPSSGGGSVELFLLLIALMYLMHMYFVRVNRMRAN